MRKRTIRDQLRERFGLTVKSAEFALLQAAKTPLDQRTDAQRYAAAGFKARGASAAVQACRMLKKSKFQEAVAWAREELGLLAAEHEEERKTALDRRRAVELLENLGEGHLGKVLGREVVLTEERWQELPEDVIRLIKSWEVDERLDGEGNLIGRRIKFKTHDPTVALRILGQMEGWNAPIKVSDATPPELEARRAAARAELAAAIRRRRQSGD